MFCGQLLKLCRVGSLTNSYLFVVRQKLVTTQPQIRLRTGWLHRRPIRVLKSVSSVDGSSSDLDKLKIEREAILINKVDEHEIIELDSHFVNEIHNSEKSRRKPEKRDSIKTANEKDARAREGVPHKEMLHQIKLPVVHKKTKEEKEATKLMKMQKSAFKTGVPLFTKLEDNDSKLSQVLLIAKSRNKREKKDLILLEGKRLIRDAIVAGHIPHMIFFSRVEDLKDLQVPNGVEIYKTTYKKLSMWSDVVTSPGVMGIFRTPAVENKEPSDDALPLTVVCDNVRDPGNMGSILRIAAGVGCSKIVLTKGCVDLWEPKVLRAAAGAHFRLPIVKDLDWNDIDSHIKNDSFVILADSNIDEEENIEGPVPVIPYYAMEYSNLDAITLIIGGETEGLSSCSFNLASACNGVRVNVPLSNSVNSLNAGTALGIVMFEMKRQIILSQQRDRMKLSSTKVV